MPEPFDPYLHWLGIRDPQRPPNYYRLLGVELFESDPVVLANAADRQMAHVRTFQTGPRSAESQRILNELAAAKVCLLNPQKKDAYDAKLRSERGLLASAPPPPPVVVGPAGAEGAVPPVVVTFRDVGRARVRSFPALALMIAVLAAMSVVVTAIILFLVHGDSPDGASRGTEQIAREGMPGLKDRVAAPSRPLLSPGPEPASPAVAKPSPESPPKAGSETKPRAAGAHEPVTSPRISGPMPENLSPEVEPDDESRPGPEPAMADPLPVVPMEEMQPDQRRPDRPLPAPGDRRMPVPDKAAHDAALKKIREVLKDQYLAAQRPADRGVLAGQLLRQAIETKDDPAIRFALLTEARDKAIAAGDGALIRQAVHEMAKDYQVEALDELAQALAGSGDGVLPPAVRKNLARTALDLATEARSGEAFDQAIRLAKIAQNLAARSRDAVTARQAAEIAASIPGLRQRHQLAQQAAKVLAQDPENAKANLDLGIYTALVKNDWRRGLPLLAKGSSPTLRAVAEADNSLGTSPAPADLVKLAEQWRKAAGAVDASLQAAVLRRALYWYQTALPQLTGITNTTVERASQVLKDADLGRRRP
jgi:hypothetical protein